MSFKTGVTPSSSFGNVLISLITPFKKLWDFPPIHLSTFYGKSNQHGRPGPVLTVMVERSVPCPSRVKTKERKQPKSIPRTISLDPPLSNITSPRPVAKQQGARHSIKTVVPLTGGSCHSRSEKDSPDVDGIIIVTPRAIERYYIDGSLNQRKVPPDTITCCCPSVIPGLGRALVCGTQCGRIYIFDRVSFDFKMIFDPRCLQEDFLALLQQEKESETVDGESTLVKGGRRTPYNSRGCLYQSPCLVSSLMLQRYIMLSRGPSSKCKVARESDAFVVPEGRKENPWREITPQGAEAGDAKKEKTTRGENLDEIFFSDALLECFTTCTGQGLTSALLETKLEDLEKLRLSPQLEVQRQADQADPQHGTGRGEATHLLPDASLPAKEGLNVKREKALESSEEWRISPKDLQLFNHFQKCLLEKKQICKVFMVAQFQYFGNALIAGDCQGRIYVWDMPSGCLNHLLKCPLVEEIEKLKEEVMAAQDNKDDALRHHPRSLVNGESMRSAPTTECHVSALVAVRSKGAEWQLWAGFGNGCLVIYCLDTGKVLQSWNALHTIRLLEYLPRMGLVISLSECFSVTAWDVSKQKRITTLMHHQLTGESPISCLKCIESEKPLRGLPQATLILGCVDGSIFIHRLFWEEFAPFLSCRSDNILSRINILPDNAPTTLPPRDVPMGDDVNQQLDEQKEVKPSDTPLKRKLQCFFLQSFIRDAEPSCPVSSLWVDPRLNALLIGDASGIVATLLPIQKLLDTLDAPSPSKADSSCHESA